MVILCCPFSFCAAKLRFLVDICKFLSDFDKNVFFYLLMSKHSEKLLFNHIVDKISLFIHYVCIYKKKELPL